MERKTTEYFAALIQKILTGEPASDNQARLVAMREVTAWQDENPGISKLRTPDGAISQAGRQGPHRNEMEDRVCFGTLPARMHSGNFQATAENLFADIAGSCAQLPKIDVPNNLPRAPSSTLSLAILTPDNEILAANLGDSPILLFCEQDGIFGMKTLYVPHNANDNEEELKRAVAAGGKVLMNGRINPYKTLVDAKAYKNADPENGGQGSFIGIQTQLTRSLGWIGKEKFALTTPDFKIHKPNSAVKNLALIVGSDGMTEPCGITPQKLLKAIQFYQSTKDRADIKRPSLASFLTAWVHGYKKLYPKGWQTDNAAVAAIDFTALPAIRERNILLAVADGSGGTECADLAITELNKWVTNRGGQIFAIDRSGANSDNSRPSR